MFLPLVTNKGSQSCPPFVIPAGPEPATSAYETVAKTAATVSGDAESMTSDPDHV